MLLPDRLDGHAQKEGLAAFIHTSTVRQKAHEPNTLRRLSLSPDRINLAKTRASPSNKDSLGEQDCTTRVLADPADGVRASNPARMAGKAAPIDRSAQGRSDVRSGPIGSTASSPRSCRPNSDLAASAQWSARHCAAARYIDRTGDGRAIQNLSKLPSSPRKAALCSPFHKAEILRQVFHRHPFCREHKDIAILGSKCLHCLSNVPKLTNLFLIDHQADQELARFCRRFRHKSCSTAL